MTLLIWLILRHHQGLPVGKDRPPPVLPRWVRAPMLPHRRGSRSLGAAPREQGVVISEAAGGPLG